MHTESLECRSRRIGGCGRPAGRKLVCGNTVVSGDNLGFVARLTNTANLDPAFGAGGMGWVSTWIIDPDQGATWCETVEEDREGRILLLERGLNYSTLQAFGAVQRAASRSWLWLVFFVLLSVGRAGAQTEGDFDPSYGDPLAPGRQTVWFDLGGSLYDSALGGVVDSAGRAVLIGLVATGDPTYPYSMGVARLTSDGQSDASFGSTLPGQFLLDLAASQELPGRSVAVEPDGSIVVAGTRLTSSLSTSVGLFARLLPDGSALSGTPVYFNLPFTPVALPPNVRGFVRDAMGRFYAYGDVLAGHDAFVARLTSSFALDPGFGSSGWVLVDPFGGSTGGTSAVRAMALDRQGRLVAAVDGESAAGDTVSAIVRFLPSGAVDSSFGIAGISRLEPDFFCGLPGTCDEIVQDLVVAPNGDIYTAGSLTAEGAAELGWIAHLDGNGTLINETVAPLTGLELILTGLVVDPRGGVVAAGATVASATEGSMHVSRYDASTLNVDPNFGLGGSHEFNFVGLPGYTQPGAGAFALVLDAGRPLAIGGAVFGPTGSNGDFAVARLYSSHIFQDGFDLGTLTQWSSVGGAP